MYCWYLTIYVVDYVFGVQIMRSEVMRISHELQAQKDKIKENTEKIKVNKTLPYLVSNVIEVSKLNKTLPYLVSNILEVSQQHSAVFIVY